MFDELIDRVVLYVVKNHELGNIVLGGLVKDTIWREDTVFARKFSAKLMQSPLWRSDQTLCKYLVSQIHADPIF